MADPKKDPIKDKTQLDETRSEGDRTDRTDRPPPKDPLELAKEQARRDEEEGRKRQKAAAEHSQEQARASAGQQPKVEELPEHLRPKKPRRFKIKEGRQVGTGGHITELRPGTIISDADSGREHIDMLLRTGLVAEQLPDEPQGEEKESLERGQAQANAETENEARVKTGATT